MLYGKLVIRGNNSYACIWNFVSLSYTFHLTGQMDTIKNIREKGNVPFKSCPKCIEVLQPSIKRNNLLE